MLAQEGVCHHVSSNSDTGCFLHRILKFQNTVLPHLQDVIKNYGEAAAEHNPMERQGSSIRKAAH